MSYSVVSIPLFDKQVKRLAKKFPSLKTDLLAFVTNLIKEPEQGKPLGNNFYKVRLASTS
jgi:mRNA-degrading endonuclease RelE of RelBE toxin-antitoxin system